MPPFAGNGVGPGQQAAVNDYAAAHAGAENHPEYTGGPRACAIAGLGQGKTVGVIGQANGALQTLLKVAGKVLADQAGGVGVLNASVIGRARAGDADAHTALHA